MGKEGDGANEPAKILLPFLQRADELQKIDRLVAYYCRLYAAQRGLAMPAKERSKTTNELLVSVMNQLERDKKFVKPTPEDNLHVEGFALNVFNKADKQDRNGRADLNTAKTFYAASIFFEVLTQFGEPAPEIEQKQKYAIWKAADIRKAISEGRRPQPGPPGGDDGFALDDVVSMEGVTPAETSPTTAKAAEPPKNQSFHEDVPSQDQGSGGYGGVSSFYAPSVPTYTPTVPPSAPPEAPSYPQPSPHGLGSPDGSYGGVPGYSNHPSGFGSSGYPTTESNYPPPASGYQSSNEGPGSTSQGYDFPSVPQGSPYHNTSQGYEHQGYPSVPQGSPYPSVPQASYHQQEQPPPPPQGSSYPAYFQQQIVAAAQTPTVQVPEPLPRTSSAPPVPDAHYQPGPDKVAEAHKDARIAVSALAFDDVPTAIDYLKRSLELLTVPSASV